MNTDFPETIIPFGGNMSEYQYTIEQAKDIAQSKSIFFCGIVRNVAKNLERNILRFQRTTKIFNKSQLFLYENDSSDNTVDILKKYESDTISFISESRKDEDYILKVGTKEDPHHYYRCQVLSECRNKYMDYIEENKIREKFDYICVVDFDIRGGWSYNGFLNSLYYLDFLDDAACMSSYGIIADAQQKFKLEEVHHSNYLFYDTFAFRPIDKDPKIHKLFTSFFNFISFKVGDPLQEVISNFNGLSIYKSKYFNHRYQTNQWEEGFVDSEHIHFHQEIRKNGGKIYLNPSMLVSYVDHASSEN